MTTRRTHVLIVINDLLRGGAQRIVADLCREYDRNQFLIEVAYINPLPINIEESVVTEIRDAGIPLHHVGEKGAMGTLMHLYRITHTIRPDILHCYLPYASILTRVVGVLSRIPVLGVQCNLPFTYPRRVRLLDAITFPFMRAWVGATSGIEVAYGGDSAPFSAERWGKGRRHFTLYAGVDAEKIAHIARQTVRETYSREFGIPSTSPMILMTARLISWKGHHDLIEAMVLLPDVHALLVGWGPLEQELKAKARANGVEARVHFLGKRMDVYQLLGAVDCYVQAHQEGVDGVWMGPNLSQIEAAAAAVPQVSTRVPCIEELIEDGVTGRLARINDPKDLARVLQIALDNTAESKQYAQLSQQRAEHCFGISAMVKTYEALYSRIR